MLDRRHIVVLTACCLWLLTVVGGFQLLANHEFAAGSSGNPRQHWPQSAGLARVDGRHTLVMAAHPRCPCTRASIEELARLMARCQGRISAHVLFFRPADAGRDWEKTDLWESARAIPGVEVRADPGGSQARLFGAETSGHALLFDGSSGDLLFAGGITASRGHAGDSLGRSTILALANGGQATTGQTPVFGCSILDSCPVQ